MNVLKQYGWEGTLVGIIGALIIALTTVTHFTAHPERPDSAPDGVTTLSGAPAFHPVPDRLPVPSTAPSIQPRASQKAPAANRKRADPLEVFLGPSSISAEFRLLSVSRTPATPTSDRLTLGIRVTSRAMAGLVTPFQSAMLEVRSHALQPIKPEHSFSYSVSAGNTREEDIAFMIPSGLSLEHTVLRILFYNEQKEIRLSLAPKADHP